MIPILLIGCITKVGLVDLGKEPGDVTDTAPGDTGNIIIDSGDTGNIIDEEIDGTVALLEWSVDQYNCTECFGLDASEEVIVDFSLSVHEPIDDVHPTWVITPGTCTENLQNVVLPVNRLDVGNTISVDGPINSFDIYKDSMNYYSPNNLSHNDIDKDSKYIVSLDNGDSFSFDSLFSFTEIQPESLRWVNSPFSTPIYRSSQVFTWSPTGSHTFVNITVGIYDENTGSLLGAVSCTGYDDGYLVIPHGYLIHYPQGSLASVHITRFDKQRTTMNDNDGFVDINLYWSFNSTGYLY